MNGDQICFRLPATLKAQIKRDAAQRGITRTNWIIHLIERGQFAEDLQRLLPKDGNRPEQPAVPPTSGAMPPQIVERALFAVCFTEALLKKLNASLNRSSSELGTVAKQARDTAQAETESLLKHRAAVAEDGGAGCGRSAAAANRAHRRERTFKARSIPGAKQRASDGARLRFADVRRHPRTGSGDHAGAGGARRRRVDLAAPVDPHARCTALPRHDARSLQCTCAPARHGDSFWSAVHCL